MQSRLSYVVAVSAPVGAGRLEGNPGWAKAGFVIIRRLDDPDRVPYIVMHTEYRCVCWLLICIVPESS